MDNVTSRFDANDAAQRTAGLESAQAAISAQRCVVMPTDTVYGIAADAFSAQAVATLLACKGRGRDMPPPVLIASTQTLDGLATDIPQEARDLAEKFWPGALTLILHAQPSLTWDLGETQGTVALRVPDDEVARELLSLTGPLAVSSANRTGQPAASTAALAFEQLGEAVDVYLEAGTRPVSGTAALGSTIVDCTLNPPRVVRVGALNIEALREVVPGLLDLGEEASNEASENVATDADALEATAQASTAAALTASGNDATAQASSITAAGVAADEVIPAKEADAAGADATASQSAGPATDS